MSNCPLEVWIGPQSTARLCLQVLGEDIWVHPCCLKTKTCSYHWEADGRCAVCGPVLLFFCVSWVSLHRALVCHWAVWSWWGVLLCCQAPQSGLTKSWDMVKKRSSKCRALNEEQVWAGKEPWRRNWCREGKNQRREDRLVSYEEPVAQQMGMRESGQLHRQNSKRKSPRFNHSQVLAFLISFLPV